MRGGIKGVASSETFPGEFTSVWALMSLLRDISCWSMQIAADVMLIIAGLCRDFAARAALQGGSTKPQSIDTRSETKGPVPFLFFQSRPLTYSLALQQGVEV